MTILVDSWFYSSLIQNSLGFQMRSTYTFHVDRLNCIITQDVNFLHLQPCDCIFLLEHLTVAGVVIIQLLHSLMVICQSSNVLPTLPCWLHPAVLIHRFLRLGVQTANWLIWEWRNRHFMIKRLHWWFLRNVMLELGKLRYLGT